jgi:hypothetical protein
MEKLRADEIALVLEASPDGAPRPRLSLPSSADADVELLSTQPSNFSIRK